MMQSVDSGDPERLVYRSGGGWLALLGLPFLAGGLAVMFGALGSGGEAFEWLFAVLFGGIFVLVGGAFVLGRAGTILDRRSGLATRWWGLLVPMRSKQFPLADFTAVRISREVRRSKNSTYTVYPVRLAGDGDAVKIGERRLPDKARELGEEVAKFLGLSLADSSLGTEVVREAGHLDESLREQAQRTGQALDVPEAPPGQRTAQSVVGDTLAIDIPPAGLRPGHVVATAVILIVPLSIAIVSWVQFSGVRRPPAALTVAVAGIVGLLVLLGVGGAAAMVHSRVKARTKVEVSPAELRVTRERLTGPRVTAISAEKLEELLIAGEGLLEGSTSGTSRLGRARVILARSDEASVAFGAGLSNEELEWLKAVIQKVVTA